MAMLQQKERDDAHLFFIGIGIITVFLHQHTNSKQPSRHFYQNKFFDLETTSIFTR